MRGLYIAFLVMLLCAGPLAAQAPPPSMQPPSQTFQGFVGDAVSIQFSVLNPPTGTPGPFVLGGQPPPGLTLNPVTGLLSGTITSSGYYYFFVSRTYTPAAAPVVTVGESYQFLTDTRLQLLTATPLPAATAGVPMTRSIVANVPVSWDVGASNLPNGVNFIFPPEVGPTLQLTGVFPPLQTPATYTFVAYAGYLNILEQSTQRTYTITVNPTPTISATLPTGYRGLSYTGTLSPRGGTAPFSFSIISGALPPGLSLNPATGAITGTPTALGVFNFVARITDSNTAFSESQLRIAVQPPPLTLNQVPLADGTVGVAYAGTVTASGGTAPYTFTHSAGTLPPGITLLSTGALQGVPTQPGQFTFQVTVTDSAQGNAFGWLTLNVLPSPLSITTLSLPAGAPGVAYSAQLQAAGGVTPYSWSVLSGNFPPGLVLDSGTGALSGAPSAAGSFTFTVQVQDAASTTAARTYTVRFAAPLSITTLSLPAGSPGVAYSAQLQAAGGVTPYSWIVLSGSFPPGLVLDSGTGALSGAPSAAGSFTFTVQVQDAASTTAARTYTVRFADPLVITTTSLPEGAEGQPYQTLLAATGGFPPYAFSLAGGSLPSGVALAADGTLSGTPGESGQFSFTAQVLDGEGLTASRVLTLTVFLRPSIVTTALPEGRVGDSYNATLEAAGRGPFLWSLASGSLPQGLALNAQTGAITGTPLQHGSFPIQVTVTDGNQPPLTASRAFTLVIALPPLPPLTVTQIQETLPPASQPSFGLQLGQGFPVELTGTAQLEFTPEGALPPDPAVRFASGGNTVNFTIPAGQTAAVPASASLFALQTGTTAGVITIRVTLRLGNAVLAPDPFAVKTVRIPASGPQITKLVIVRNPAGFEIQITGYSNTRQITGATFRFTPAPGASLGTAEINVPVATVFQTWFASAESRQHGGQFLLVVPFTLQGTAGALASVQVTLANSAGSGTASANF